MAYEILNARNKSVGYNRYELVSGIRRCAVAHLLITKYLGSLDEKGEDKKERGIGRIKPCIRETRCFDLVEWRRYQSAITMKVLLCTCQLLHQHLMCRS